MNRTENLRMRKYSRYRSHARDKTSQSNSASFFIYIMFTISYFLHMPVRIPDINVIRPDLIMASLIVVSLIFSPNQWGEHLNNKVTRVFIVLFLYIFVSLPFVEWPGSVIRDHLFEFLKVIVFFFFTVTIISSDKRLKIFVFVFVLCQMFRVMEPLYLHFTQGYWGDFTHVGPNDNVDRLSGAPSDIINPNELGFVIATLFPFLHYLFGSSTIKMRVFYYSLAPLLLYALVLTMSRSGMIALLVVVWNIFMKSRHKTLLVILFAGVSIFTWLNLSDIHKDRYLSLTGDTSTESYATAKGRFDGALFEWKVGFQDPVVGHGLGTSLEAKFNFSGSTFMAHDFYTEIFIEMGALGLAIYLYMIKTLFDLLRDCKKRIGEIESHDLATAIDYRDGHDKDIKYYKMLYMALSSCFWMYLIFSLAMYGVRQYHWYLLAGLAVVLSRNLRKIQNNMEPDTSGSSMPALLK